jgi:hypothetical protein
MTGCSDSLSTTAAASRLLMRGGFEAEVPGVKRLHAVFVR